MRLERELLIHYVDPTAVAATSTAENGYFKDWRIYQQIDDDPHALIEGKSGTAIDNENLDWQIIGSDIEEMSVELNADTTQFKNILGQSKVKDNGFQPSMSAEPYYADPEDPLYKPLRVIAMDRLKGDNCRTLMLEILVEDAEALKTNAAKHLAYIREVVCKPTSYGGNTDGVSIPFSIMENGDKVKGYVVKHLTGTSPNQTWDGTWDFTKADVIPST